MTVTSRHNRAPAMMKGGEHIYHRHTGRYLGKITEVRRYTVRFTSPFHTHALATRNEITVGPDPENV